MRLRRDAIAIPGTIQLLVREPNTSYLKFSQPIPASMVEPIDDWYTFDFNHNPIEVLAGDSGTFDLTISASPEYTAADAITYGEGVQVGYEVEEGNNVAYFQIHQLRDDVEIDYYRNTTDALASDDSEIQIPQRYHRTLIKMVLGRLWKKQGRDLQTALVYDRETKKEISYARSQAAVKTLGPFLRTERNRRGSRRPYMTYAGGGRFRGRLW